MNLYQSIGFCLFIVLSFFNGSDGKLPPNIKICSRNDPNIAKCIIESVSLLQPRLANGVLGPDFKIPSLEPLKLEPLVIDRGPNFQVYINNFVVTRGASRFVIDRMKVNLVEPTFDFLITLPRLEYTGKYNLKVRIALALIQGEGDLVGRSDNYKARVRLNGKKYQKNGKTYVNFDKIQIKIMPGQSKIELKNLFENSPALSSIGNSIINENSDNFITDIIPSLERSLADTFTRAANEIVKNASWDEMFPN